MWLQVPKLDYLQLLAVEWVRDGAKVAGRALVRAMRSISVNVQVRMMRVLCIGLRCYR